MIVEAGFLNFVETLLIILLIFFGIRILFRMLLPYLLRYLGRKAEEKLKQKFQQMTNFNEESSPKPEPSLKKEKRKVGEYIEYEEIE